VAEHQRLFDLMINLLDLLPVDWTLIKKTKIGKAVNSTYKGAFFEDETQLRTAALVNKWKVMV
jgi:hypothetical protein